MTFGINSLYTCFSFFFFFGIEKFITRYNNTCHTSASVIDCCYSWYKNDLSNLRQACQTMSGTSTIIFRLININIAYHYLFFNHFWFEKFGATEFWSKISQQLIKQNHLRRYTCINIPCTRTSHNYSEPVKVFSWYSQYCFYISTSNGVIFVWVTPPPIRSPVSRKMF